ncbi:hypothetical protein P167DRAFT_540659 [Morchella conica CCBAS932]|uniref:Fungal N-terminal domain-containing protein n=1 Tax=Morchella conica CCBAS932 TaxID=1392247 RepID=A0A3N4K7Y9_9PEZI|nr:hypothetical protein P167DRAFT_540659 [Morchella conica CCBAS932]
MEVAASIVGLLAASIQVAGMLKLFISSVKNAPATAEQLYNEINRFRFILRRIQDKTISSDANDLSPERATLIDVNLLGSTLTAPVFTFSELEKEMDRIKPRGKLDFWDRVKWMRPEKNLLNTSLRLNRHETSLTLIFSILTWNAILIGASFCPRQ